MNIDEARVSVRSTAQALVGQTVLTLARRRPNRIIAVSEEGIEVRARSIEVISWEMVDSVVDALFQWGELTGEELRRARVPGGFRSAFIFSLLDLTSFARAEVERGTIRLRLAETPGTVVLAQRRHQLTYDDEVGVVYQYPKQYWKSVVPGSLFVYYEPREKDAGGHTIGRVYFGAGVIGQMEPDPKDKDLRFVDILDYKEFPTEVPFKDRAGSYAEAPGETPVFRSAVRRISKAAYARITELGGLGATLSGRSRWRDAVLGALRSYSNRNATRMIRRQDLLSEERERIVTDTRTHGATPDQTISRVLQELRNEGMLYFLGRGTYLLLDTPLNVDSEDLPNRALAFGASRNKLRIGAVATSDEEVLGRRRKGQDRIRAETLHNYGGMCAFCDVTDERLLVASHVSRWADDPEGRGDLTNVICMCQFHDALFEVGYLSLSDDLMVLRRDDGGSTSVASNIDAAEVFRLPAAYPPAPKYLMKHRKRTRHDAN